MEAQAQRAEFWTDLASAARALVSQPSVPLVSLAVMLLPNAPRSADHSILTMLFGAADTASVFFLFGWYGAERVFFQRHLGGRPVTLRHLVALVPKFIDRFFVLGVQVGIVFLTYSFGLARVLGIDIAHIADTGPPVPLSFQVILTAFLIAMDFVLTFVTPALAYTTRSAGRALGIGFAMIRHTWPRSALYVLCPPLALSDMNYICPSGGVVFHFILTAVLTLVGLVAKGAIAVFYLRERGSYSEDGAAYITAQDEPP